MVTNEFVKIGESSKVAAEAILEAASKFANAKPKNYAHMFFTAGTGVPDEMAVEYFKDSDVTVITRDGVMHKNGLCGGSPYRHKENKDVVFMPKEADGVGVAFFRDGHTEDIRSKQVFSDGDCIKFLTFTGEYWYEKHVETRPKFSKYDPKTDEYRPTGIEKIVLFEE